MTTRYDTGAALNQCLPAAVRTDKLARQRAGNEAGSVFFGAGDEGELVLSAVSSSSPSDASGHTSPTYVGATQSGLARLEGRSRTCVQPRSWAAAVASRFRLDSKRARTRGDLNFLKTAGACPSCSFSSSMTANTDAGLRASLVNGMTAMRTRRTILRGHALLGFHRCQS